MIASNIFDVLLYFFPLTIIGSIQWYKEHVSEVQRYSAV